MYVIYIYIYIITAWSLSRGTSTRHRLHRFRKGSIYTLKASTLWISALHGMIISDGTKSYKILKIKNSKRNCGWNSVDISSVFPDWASSTFLFHIETEASWPCWVPNDGLVQHSEYPFASCQTLNFIPSSDPRIAWLPSSRHVVGFPKWGGLDHSSLPPRQLKFHFPNAIRRRAWSILSLDTTGNR